VIEHSVALPIRCFRVGGGRCRRVVHRREAQPLVEALSAVPGTTETTAARESKDPRAVVTEAATAYFVATGAVAEPVNSLTRRPAP
jgi:hypothetical protein